jgi:hypothetical protein
MFAVFMGGRGWENLSTAVACGELEEETGELPTPFEAKSS